MRCRQHRRQRLGPGAHLRAIEPVRLVDDDEHVVSLVDRFRRAEQQVAVGPQREMEEVEHAALDFPIEVDEQVAAATRDRRGKTAGP